MIEQLIAGLFPETIAKIHWVTEGNSFEASQVERGLVAIHAPWGGYSTLNGKSMLKLLDEFRQYPFQIYLIDIDSIRTEKQEMLFGYSSMALFESIWVDSGKVEHNYRWLDWGKSLDEFRSFLQRKFESGTAIHGS